MAYNDKVKPFNETNDSHNVSSSMSSSGSYVPDYVPVQNNEEKASKRVEPFSKKKKVVVGAGIILGLIAVSSVVNETFGTEPLNERVEELSLEGLPQSVAEEQLRETITDYESIVLSSENIEEDEEVELEYIVGNVLVFDERVELQLAYHPYDVISNMGLEGVSLPEAERELARAGYQRDQDYTVYTDGPDMYVESNWSILEIRPTEGERFTEIIVTNSTLEEISETTGSLVEGVQDEWTDYNNTIEEERQDRAQGRTDVSELIVGGDQWSEAERILYQNDWHASDYIVRTDTGMPVLNSRNWNVIEVDEDLEDRPVVFLGK